VNSTELSAKGFHIRFLDSFGTSEMTLHTE